MGPRVRKVALTSHVISSVGWLGAVVAYLALAIVGLISEEPASVRGAYVAMGVIGWAVIVPLGAASFLGGILQSVATPWGLARHYWVVFKLAITVIATILLLLHMGPTSTVARAAVRGPLVAGDLHAIRVQLLFDAVAAIVALTATTALSVVKPRGLTRRGLRATAKLRPA